jgi:hypothetical protein
MSKDGLSKRWWDNILVQFSALRIQSAFLIFIGLGDLGDLTLGEGDLTLGEGDLTLGEGDLTLGLGINSSQSILDSFKGKYSETNCETLLKFSCLFVFLTLSG